MRMKVRGDAAKVYGENVCHVTVMVRHESVT